ncbi:uncharacterized protein Z519_05831 [Cladophialophora bantiana CBS 173.52]|uniref:CBM21 domain-containing protein n=1 Tax=Cladophialophora bantiana (strain ATCC 10958 / CBS 173.52 / CDC B-1940 / NIH 8579) TaxID=1442370 RepID=A0A0D2ETH6_CLAB1|nr:uncharacterized protein Z519_05831 [Cladophialophora bantiana CBS 173.52]KIW93226.1 hypothetical protein Z519_05831 [Cladophialophora bantiana CBS 173.52]
MPYTPPSHHTPTSSKQSSPTPSRSHSYIKGPLHSPESSERHNLPRSNGSSSYLTKHRRSPSLNDAKNDILHNGEAYEVNGAFDPHGSIRQSPPPVTNALIPAGMTISPPDSSHNSSDEDEPERGRPRDLEDNLQIQALQEAIRSMDQRKLTGSPTRGEDNDCASTTMTDLVITRLDGTQSAGPAVLRLPLSQEARKISHSRSSTDSSIVFEPPSRQIPSVVALRPDTDDSDSDNPPAERPIMVRKKSGELVRPALRASSRRRPSSMPGTPTYSKAVHFDSHLEHVRHFLQVDRPLAVSAGSSPVENYESESDFPFGSDETNARPRTPSYEWDIRLNNFPTDLGARKSQPVFVERIFLSSDNRNLIGTVAVQNLAFHKLVVARFTFDYWKTTSETVADYNNDVRRKGNHDGLDRFNFTIKLEDQTNLESKTLFFCIRYNVSGQEFWDNNAGANYQVDFSKKSKTPQSKSSSGERPLNGLPRSRPSAPTSSARPVSMPTSFDDFSTGFDSFGSFVQSPSSLIGEPKLKLRSPKSKAELIPDAPQRRKQAGPQAFGNRYDFKTSLTAAKNNAYAAMGEWSGLGPRTYTKQSSHEVSAAAPVQTVANAAPKHETGVNGVKVGANKTAPAVAPLTSKPAALLSEKPSLSSQSYKELVDKYCFFGSGKIDCAVKADGSAESASASDVSNGGSSSDSSGSTTPTPPRSMSPVLDSQSPKSFTQYVARSASPVSRTGGYFGSRSGSPASSFGYPYHSATQHTLMPESPTPTAIHG